MIFHQATFGKVQEIKDFEQFKPPSISAMSRFWDLGAFAKSTSGNRPKCKAWVTETVLDLSYSTQFEQLLQRDKVLVLDLN